MLAVSCAAVSCANETKKPAPTENAGEIQNPHAQETTSLEPGAKAPAISLKLHDGTTVDLQSLVGKQVLVYFYPKDETPGCTIEAEGLRDGWATLQAAGLVVYGVSTQDEASHKAFIEKHKLPFPLVVDTDGQVAKAFHVPMRNDHAARQSFLIGRDGKIKQVWLEVDPKEHAATILAAAKNG